LCRYTPAAVVAAPSPLAAAMAAREAATREATAAAEGDTKVPFAAGPVATAANAAAKVGWCRLNRWNLC